MPSSTTLSRLSSLLPTASSSLQCVTRTALSSPIPSSSFPLVLTRSYERLVRQPPPRRPHTYFQQLAEQRRAQPPPPNTSASLTHTTPLQPLTIHHTRFHNQHYTAIQQLEHQLSLTHSNRSLDATATPTAQAGGAGAVFAVVELNGGQWKVVEDDLVMCDKVRGVEVGSRLVLDNVLVLGSVEWSVIGRPVVPGAGGGVCGGGAC